MAELEQIVQNMMKAGESEDDIKNVVEHYNAEKSRSATDDDFSEAPSWGSKLKKALDFKIDYTNVKSKDRISVDPKGSIMPDLYTKQKQEKELKTERQKDPNWQKEAKELRDQLESAFGEDPKLFEKMIKNPSDLSLQERKATAGMFGKPEEYLLDIVKEEVGGMGWRGRDAIDPKTGLPKYSNLTNADIENIVSDKFYDKLAFEKRNKGNELAEGIIKLTEVEGGEGIQKYKDRIRSVFVNSYTGVDGEIAKAVELLNHSDLKEGERDEVYKNLLELKKQSKTSMLYDLNTRKLTIARDQKDADDKKKKNENLVDLGVKDKQAEWNDKLGRLKPEDQLDYLRNEYERSALTYAGHRTQINEVRDWSIRKSGYEIAADPKGGNRKIVSKSLNDLMMDTEFADFAPVPAEDFKRKKGESDKDYKKRKGTLIDEWEGNIAGLKQDDLEYTRDFEALKGMYLLNQGIVDIEKPKYIGIIPRNYSALKQSAAALIKPWTSEYYAENLMGSTGRTMLTATDEVYNNLGIKKTAAEEKQLKVSLAESVNEGVLGMNKMLFEFYGINKFLGVVGAEAAFGNLINRLQKGTKFVRNGKVYTEAVINARAAKQFPKLKQAEATKQYLHINKGLRRFSSPKDKGTAILASGLMEAGKFEVFTQFDITKGKFKPEAGEQFGAWTGFGFGAMGRIIAPLSPLLQRKGYLKDIDKRISLGKKEVRIGLNSRKLFETFVTQPASFAVGSEAGEYIHALADDAFGNADYSNYMENHYGEYGEVGKRLLTNYFIGLGLGTGHFKGFADYKSKAALKRTQTKAYEEMQELGKSIGLSEAELNNMFSEATQRKIHGKGIGEYGLGDKGIEQFYKHWEVFDGMGARIHNLHRAEGYMDPDRADEQVRQEHEGFIEKERQAGRIVKTEVVNNQNLRLGQQGIDPKRNAEISTDPVSKITTIRYNAERYTPDVMAHEVHHYYTEKLLGESAMFNTDLMRHVGSTAGKIKLARLITEEQAKELGNESLQGEKMTLAQSIKLKKFDVLDPVNNQRIKQWELFGHIAQEIGNKNNYFDITESDGFLGLKNLLKPLINSSGKKVNLSTEADVVRWFRDYARNVKKGNYSEVVKLFDELKTVVDNNVEIKKEVAGQEGRTGRDTYSSEILDLGDGRKINNPKELAEKTQKEYKAKLAEGKSKLDIYRELADPNPTSPNYSKNYPVLGNKLGPMLDIAIASWNRTVGEPFRISLSDRSWESKRSALAMDFRADTRRGFEDIFKRYEPSEGKLMTWVVGQSRLRMQEIIERGIGKITDIRESKVGEWTEWERIFEDVDVAGGKVDKSLDAQNPNIERKGIYLPEHKFTFPDGSKRTMNPASVDNIKAESKKVFYESKLEENTGVKIGEKLKPITEATMNEMIGVKEGMKPEKVDAIQSEFFGKNKPISYDAGLELTSNPNFYENTNAARTIFKFAHKNTGVKYKTAELTVEEARRTNARAYKYEKLKATPERIDKVQEVINSGRDAGVRVAKQNVLKNGIGKHFGNQIYRESLKEIKQEIESKLKDPTSDIKYWSEQKAKLEGVMAELAMRKLRGAVPEKLASSDLDIMNDFIREVKSVDYAKELFPGFNVRNIIENNKKYYDLLEKTGGVDNFLNSMGYELKGIDLKTFQKYAEAQRILETLETKAVAPEIFENWTDAKETIENLIKNDGVRSQLKIAQKGWYKDYDSVKEFDGLVDWLRNNTLSEVFDSQMMKKSVGIGLGKIKWALDYDGNVATRNNPHWFKLLGGKSLPASKGKTPKWVKQYKTVDNSVFKEAINKELETADLSTAEKKQKFAKYITKKYLTNKNVTYEDTIKANEKMQEYVYGKLFDYYKGSTNKALALNNIFRLLQMQTSIGNGFTRSLATHNAITLRHVKNWGKGEGLEKTHSEHEFQAFGFNANFMLNMIKNAGNKTTFLNNFKPLAKIFKQSIIDRNIQAKYDGEPYGGKTGFDFKFTTESGKYPWLREMAIAETTLDLKTGKTYDQLLTDVIGGAKNIKLLEARTNKLFSENLNIKVDHLSPSEKIIAAKIIDEAVTSGRKRKKKSRSMSTWDFDDTLAYTKSGVRYTLPNPSGKPAPRRKVIFLAGGAGSGKSNVVKKLGLQEQGFKVVNQDISLEWLMKNHGLPTSMSEFTAKQRSQFSKLSHEARQIALRKKMKFQGKGDGVIVDGTGASLNVMKKNIQEFKDKGYDVQMLFVETSKEVAHARNKARKERSLMTKIVETTWESVQGNKEAYKKLFGKRFAEVNTDNLKMGDAMPPELIRKLDAFTKGYIKARLNAGEFADKGAELKEQGAEFDFAEFDVIKQGEPGPFFQKALDRAKKYGTENQFILTARPPEAALHIQEFLKSLGLDIPLENITGLGNSTAEAKAMWMLEKFSEGYNDMYFADDAVQNVKEVKHVLDQLDIKSKVVQVDQVKDVNKLDSPGTYKGILASRNLRLEYEKTITKHRPDLVKEGLVSRTVDDMFDFIDTLNVPANKKKKYEQVTTKWLATSNIKLKEDAYKIKQAVEIAEKYKEDIFSYRNPNELIEKYAGKIKKKPLDPNKTKEFTFSGEHKKRGITVYEVQNTKEGQQAVRDIVNTHWGIDSNPWCITKAKKGKLTEDAWLDWTAYEKGPKRIIFHNGKLSSFYANRQYWDRMDNATDGPTIIIKKGRVTNKVELVPDGTGRGVVEEFIRETRTVSKDKKTVTKEIFADSQDGYAEGTKIVENKVNGITVKSTRYNPEGNVVEIKEFSKDGKAIASYNFFPDGKMSAVNTHGQPFGEMSREDVVMKKGDVLSHQVLEGGISYMYGKINLDAQGIARDRNTHPIAEIGWKVAEKNSDLKNVIKTVDGKVRLDLKKVLEIDPDTKGLPRKAAGGMRAIEPVKKVLDQLDVKSDVQQALASERLDVDINTIMEHSLGVESGKRFSKAEGKVRGKDIKRRRIIMPDSAADMELLIEPLLGKGKEGIASKKWFEKNFYKPWERGVNDLNTARQTILNDYMSLRKQNKDVTKQLDKAVEGTNFTVDQAMRIYIWNKNGFKIPDLVPTTEAKLVEHIKNNPKLQSYADRVATLTKIETGLKKPSAEWWAETLASEVSETGRTVDRQKYIADWIEAKNEIFSETNLNKMESRLGSRWRSDIEDMFNRMETGRTRGRDMGRIGNKVMNYLNGSVGAIMNLNTRSATLQLISSVNFINHAENNPFAAARAFANQPQYWKDFMRIMNSDMLLQRRAGLKINVTEAELAAAVDGKGSKAKRALAWILKQGYIPTKVADSFAIASGGATYLRNRIRMYEKQGLETKEAEKKAWIDFQSIAEKTQQSSRADLLSRQQTSFEGRLILPFSNTPMQMNRIMMKEMLDLSKGRYEGFFGENSFTNKMSKISYYGAIQSLIFAGLQSGLFALMANGGDDEMIAKKKIRTVNTMTDSFLRGMGIQGAVTAGLKNAILKFLEQNEKGYNADYTEVGEALLNISPTIGSKVSKMDGAGNTYNYNKKEILKKGFSLDNTKAIEASAQTIEAITNVPIHRVIRKTQNMQGALDKKNEDWQRLMMLLGWSKWDVGIIEKKKKKKKKKKRKVKYF
jgi:predicted kinase